MPFPLHPDDSRVCADDNSEKGRMACYSIIDFERMCVLPCNPLVLSGTSTPAKVDAGKLEGHKKRLSLLKTRGEGGWLLSVLLRTSSGAKGLRKEVVWPYLIVSFRSLGRERHTDCYGFVKQRTCPPHRLNNPIVNG